VILQLFSVVEKYGKEFVKITDGQLFGCAASTEPISMGATAPTAPKTSAPMKRGRSWIWKNKRTYLFERTWHSVAFYVVSENDYNQIKYIID